MTHPQNPTSPGGRSGRRSRLAALALAGATLLALVAPLPGAEGAVPGGLTDGLMCEPSDNGTFNLDAVSGYVATPDGNSVYMWSYSASGRSFQLPGPTLCVKSGDAVTVVLHNTLRENTSIVFGGQTDVRADGHAVQQEYDATGALTSLVDSAPATNGVVTYTFTAGSPGTYLYSSGTDVTKQREMGLYGALVVRPAGAAGDTAVVDRQTTGQVTADASTAFKGEFLYLLSDIDPNLHAAVERNRAYNYNTSTARYFFINGRSMPDTLSPNNASWLPAQPYGSLIHVEANAQQPAVVRYLNAGSINFPFHPHGSSQRIVNRDGVATQDTGGNDASYYKFLLDVNPGQSVDALERFDNIYDAAGTGGTTCSSVTTALADQCAAIPSDIELPQLQDQIVGPGTETWFNENPYIGGAAGAIPNGMVQNNVCGEFYQIAHSHALQQATNYGASFGGMMTLIRIDPPHHYGCA